MTRSVHVSRLEHVYCSPVKFELDTMRESDALDLPGIVDGRWALLVVFTQHCSIHFST